MGKKTRQELEASVARQLPDHEVVSSPPAADAGPAPAADFHLPELSTLKSKWDKYRYVGPSPSSADAAAASPSASDPEPVRDVEVHFVKVQPKGRTADDLRRGPGPKVVIVDDDGKIIGAQG